MSVRTATCQLGCVSEGHVNILPKKQNNNNKKKAVECSFLVWPLGAAGAVLPLLQAQGWRSKVISFISRPHLLLAPSVNKQFFFSSSQTATSQADRRATMVIKGRMLCQEACKDPLSVVSHDQLHCKCLRGTRSS